MKLLLGSIEENIMKAAEIIRRGGLVVFPTETVYGLGANALDKIAVAKIFEVKNRPHFDPIIVHIANKEDIFKYTDIDERILRDVEKLITNFWPGPLTLVLKKRKRGDDFIIPSIVTAGLDKVGIRMPNNPIALKLISYAGVPIAAPSANPFGYISFTTPSQILETISDKVDIILDGGKAKVGIESTVITFEDSEEDSQKVILLRPGALEIEKIQKLLNKQVIPYNQAKIIAPGQTTYHYKPIKNLFLVNTNKIDLVLNLLEKENIDFTKCYFIFQSKDEFYKNNYFQDNEKKFLFIDYFSEDGNLYEVAYNLFEKLYIADRSDKEYIVVEVCGINYGLALAINNRLDKAKTKKLFV